ncbi:MAG TPA: hypothetical protein VIQ99_00965 [Gammaproteobacteria bacterium]
MDTTSQRAKVIELFEKHRAAPGAPPRAVYDSFRGLRRFNAFVRARIDAAGR